MTDVENVSFILNNGRCFVKIEDMPIDYIHNQEIQEQLRIALEVHYNESLCELKNDPVLCKKQDVVIEEIEHISNAKMMIKLLTNEEIVEIGEDTPKMVSDKCTVYYKVVAFY
uniref:Uncharacterized protein n=1 Tax=Marseillevirus LCMAC201 TaxID=2506605 RepID=A0A481YVZ3_9VIRU|nr:MAG: hypothetical protein LCMAC201_00920 [Marseillevirus LCMAC201]